MSLILMANRMSKGWQTNLFLSALLCSLPLSMMISKYAIRQYTFDYIPLDVAVNMLIYLPDLEGRNCTFIDPLPFSAQHNVYNISWFGVEIGHRAVRMLS